MKLQRKFMLKRVPEYLTDIVPETIKYFFTNQDNNLIMFVENESLNVFGKTKANGKLKIISKEEFEKNKSVKIGRIVNFVRFNVPINDDNIAKVDIYTGEHSGLKTVSVKIEEQNYDKFIIPKWFGEEITFNAEYKKFNLSHANLKEIIK